MVRAYQSGPKRLSGAACLHIFGFSQEVGQAERNGTERFEAATHLRGLPGVQMHLRQSGNLSGLMPISQGLIA